MQAPPNYSREAALHPFNRGLLFALAVAGLGGLWRGTAWPLLVLGAAEIAWLVVVPRRPGFRRRCDAEQRDELARQRALDLERVAAKLSPNAKSRLASLARDRDRILDGLRTVSAATPALVDAWSGRLEALMNGALRILVFVDATRADDRDRRFVDSELAQLEEEVANPGDGPARAARAQRLEGLRRRKAGFAAVQDQREAAIVQLDTMEDLLRDLLAQGLSGRDAAAFGAQLDQLAAQVAATGETIGELDRGEAALASLRAASR